MATRVRPLAPIWRQSTQDEVCVFFAKTVSMGHGRAREFAESGARRIVGRKSKLVGQRGLRCFLFLFVVPKMSVTPVQSERMDPTEFGDMPPFTLSHIQYPPVVQRPDISLFMCCHYYPHSPSPKLYIYLHSWIYIQLCPSPSRSKATLLQRPGTKSLTRVFKFAGGGVNSVKYRTFEK